VFWKVASTVPAADGVAVAVAVGACALEAAAADVVGRALDGGEELSVLAVVPTHDVRAAATASAAVTLAAIKLRRNIVSGLSELVMTGPRPRTIRSLLQ
jgi:hypothetical protein